MWSDLQRAPLRYRSSLKDYRRTYTNVPSVRSTNQERDYTMPLEGSIWEQKCLEMHTGKRKTNNYKEFAVILSVLKEAPLEYGGFYSKCAKCVLCAALKSQLNISSIFLVKAAQFKICSNDKASHRTRYFICHISLPVLFCCFHTFFSPWQCLHRAFPNPRLCWAVSGWGPRAYLWGGRGGCGAGLWTTGEWWDAKTSERERESGLFSPMSC